jgi:hypothetical protein
MGKIITPRFKEWAAPGAWVNELAQSIPDKCIVNAGGEVAPFDPGAISLSVQSGQVWLDYCGCPMYYIDRLPIPGPWNILGQDGFAAFLRRADALFVHDFWADKEGFVYPRSLRVREVNVPPFITPNPYTPKTANIFSSFCMKLGDGYYFYAYAHPSGQGVSPRDYARFVNDVLKPVPSIPDIPVIDKFPPWLLAIGGAAVLLAVVSVFGGREE